MVVLAAVAFAQGDRLDAYYEKISEAVRIYNDPALELDQGGRIDLAYEVLGKAAFLADERWEAFLERGHNRCMAVHFMRVRLQEQIVFERARGTDPATLENLRRIAKANFIEPTLQQAYHDFVQMERRMRSLGERDGNVVDFASASMKFVSGEYLEAKRGAPGAIEDFKKLAGRGYRTDRCSENVALCYVDLAYQAVDAGKLEKAQEYWDEALGFAKYAGTRQAILTNKASAFAIDNEFELAESILRDLIRREPFRPGHYKNLGLALGYQGRLKEALHYYAVARDRATRNQDGGLRRLHGNAWLRPAAIHGKLLDQDGDMLVAWRLFLEYRAVFQDDYNFSLAFGDFLQSHEQYETAVVFLEHARDLQPHCPQAYELLLQIAPRTEGTREEVSARIAKYKEQREEATKQFNASHETPAVERTCGGLTDLGDPGTGVAAATRIEPDPLAAYGPDDPPEWVRDVASRRKPFVAWTPPPDDGPAGPAAGNADAAGAGVDGTATRGRLLLFVGAGAALCALVAAIFLFRRTASTA
jgi:tetratricopeptide (TPR) repeat protein